MIATSTAFREDFVLPVCEGARRRSKRRPSPPMVNVTSAPTEGRVHRVLGVEHLVGQKPFCRNPGEESSQVPNLAHALPSSTSRSRDLSEARSVNENKPGRNQTLPSVNVATFPALQPRLICERQGRSELTKLKAQAVARSATNPPRPVCRSARMPLCRGRGCQCWRGSAAAARRAHAAACAP